MPYNDIPPYWKEMAPWHNDWLHKHYIDADPHAHPAPILYDCVTVCGGLGDRIRGMTTMLWLAYLYDKPLLMDWSQLESIMEPNLIPWTWENTGAKPLQFTDLGRHPERRDLLIDYTAKLITGKPTAPIVVNNAEVLIHLIQHHSTSMDTVRLSYYTRFTHIARRHFAYHVLFRPTASVLTFVDEIKPPCKYYHAVHIRMGGAVQGKLGFVDPQIGNPAKIDEITTCIAKTIKTFDVCVYLASDNAAIKKKLSTVSGVYQFEQLQIGNIAHNKASADGYEISLLHLYAEWLVLSKASGFIHVIPSGYSQTAYSIAPFSPVIPNGPILPLLQSCCTSDISVYRGCRV